MNAPEGRTDRHRKIGIGAAFHQFRLPKRKRRRVEVFHDEKAVILAFSQQPRRGCRRYRGNRLQPGNLELIAVDRDLPIRVHL